MSSQQQLLSQRRQQEHLERRSKLRRLHKENSNQKDSHSTNASVIEWLATAIHRLIKTQHLRKTSSLMRFSELKRPVDGIMQLEDRPSRLFVKHYLECLFTVGYLSPSTGVVAFILLYRLIKPRGGYLHVTNWRPIVLISTIIASKIWEEESVWNTDYLEVCPKLTGEELTHLERIFLQCIDWKTLVSPDEYTHFFAKLSKTKESNTARSPHSKLQRKHPPTTWSASSAHYVR
eukprot:TRINITY_DN2966_c0_g1_i3.p1 TRINITY_DN2966_c0_g1~~TRINITY_DN2966_c0_g1_i3.p1  ORF type:complete len:233 (+),score=26.44 TRINITY_DN2966_c0_g1_i3:46-744(+)